jgi:Dioxygenase
VTLGMAPGVTLALGAAAGVALAWPAGLSAAACRDRTPTTWDIVVAPANEPGEPFELTGRVLNAADRKPLADVSVYVYHADLRGRYNAKGDESGEPRLCGVLRTNARGEYRVRTKLPGGYDGYLPHVHFEYWGRGIGRQHAFVNLARKAAPPPARTPPKSGAPSNLWQVPAVIREDRTAIERPIVRNADSVWTCTRDLLVH